MRLTVNVDHVATVRNARGVAYPDPVHAAVLAEAAGADGVTAHLREDRRHIRERDVELIRATCRRFNLEMARTPEMTGIALRVKPDLVTLVPERREELTTEGGLHVARSAAEVAEDVARLQEAGIPVSLFVDPDPAQIAAAANTHARFVELHTGRYADARSEEQAAAELAAIARAAEDAAARGLRVNAGHGLRLDNVAAVARIPQVEELAIGHSIVARAVLVGMREAVREMREAIRA